MAEGKKNRSKTSMEQEPLEDEIIEGEIVDEGDGKSVTAAAADAEAVDAKAVAETDDAGAGDAPTTAEMSKEYTQLAEELQQAQGKAKEYFEGWQRERADFANYKRRIERDQQLLSANLKGDVIKKYLTILDDLERAMKAKPGEGPSASWANGIELIMRKLQSILEAEGVRRIPAETEMFNPARHEAITHEDSPNHKSGEIIEVVQQGYTLGDRVLRPALVRVAR